MCALNNDMVTDPGSSRLCSGRNRPGSLRDRPRSLSGGSKRRGDRQTVITQPVYQFPVQCDIPDGEDSSYVLYGSGGVHSLRQPSYERWRIRRNPAALSDLDLGERAGLRWACTAKLASFMHIAPHPAILLAEDLDRALKSTTSSFWRERWAIATFRGRRHNVLRLKAGKEYDFGRAHQPRVPCLPEICLFWIWSTARWPSFQDGAWKPVILIASPYLPFPLSHEPQYASQPDAWSRTDFDWFWWRSPKSARASELRESAQRS